MKISIKKLIAVSALFLIVQTHTVKADEVHNFNVTVSGTFTPIEPDNCAITPIGVIDLGTLPLVSIGDAGHSRISLNGTKLYDTGYEVTLMVNCSNSINYTINAQPAGGIPDLHQVGNASWCLSSPLTADSCTHNTVDGTISSTGTGSDQTFIFKILIGESTDEITNLTGSFSAVIPMTLTVQ